MRVPPTTIVGLFKHSLPAEILSAFLAAVDEFYLPDAAELALDTLRALTGAGRFSILAMCLDKRDTQAVASIFIKLDAARQQGHIGESADGLQKLRKLFS